MIEIIFHLKISLYFFTIISAQDVYVSLVEVYLTVKLNLLFLTEMYILSSMIRLLCVIKASNSKKHTHKRALFQRSAHCSKTRILQEEGWLFPSLEEFHKRSVFSSSMPEKPTSIVKAKAFDAHKDC